MLRFFEYLKEQLPLPTYRRSERSFVSSHWNAMNNFWLAAFQNSEAYHGNDLRTKGVGFYRNWGAASVGEYNRQFSVNNWVET